MRELLQVQDTQTDNRQKQELARTTSRLNELETGMLNDLDRLDRDIITEAEYTKRAEVRRQEQSVLEVRKGELESNIAVQLDREPQARSVPVRVGSFLEDFQRMDVVKAKAILQTIVKVAHVWKDGKVEYESLHSELEALQNAVDGISEYHGRYSEMQNHIVSIDERLQAFHDVLDKIQNERQVRDSVVDQRLGDLRRLGQKGANAQKDVVSLANYVKSELIPAVDKYSHERRLIVYRAFATASERARSNVYPKAALFPSSFSKLAIKFRSGVRIADSMSEDSPISDDMSHTP